MSEGGGPSSGQLSSMSESSGAGSAGPQEEGAISQFVGKAPPGIFGGLSTGGSLLGGMTGGKNMDLAAGLGKLPTPSTAGLGRDMTPKGVMM